MVLIGGFTPEPMNDVWVTFSDTAHCKPHIIIEAKLSRPKIKGDGGCTQSWRFVHYAPFTPRGFHVSNIVTLSHFEYAVQTKRKGTPSKRAICAAGYHHFSGPNFRPRRLTFKQRRLVRCRYEHKQQTLRKRHLVRCKRECRRVFCHPSLDATHRGAAFRLDAARSNGQIWKSGNA